MTLLLAIPLAPAVRADPLTSEIKGALQEGVEAWNAGDLPRFMGGYLNSPDLIFTSSARVIRGYDALEKRYAETYGTNKQSMGQLRFDRVEAWPLGSEHALAVGEWHLQTKGRTKETMEGVFSLVLRKTSQGWKILHDHTSRTAPPPEKKT